VAEGPRLAGLDHLVLTVEDLEATLEFYTRVMGMSVRAFEGGRLALRFGSQKINLHEAGREFEPHARRPLPGSADLCFATEASPEDWLEHLAASGVEVVEGPVCRPGALGPMTSIYFQDPDGNLIEVASYS
jgi:catechol 2,3-dioxygenase-like lactoylglutathione lyase family enzyme